MIEASAGVISAGEPVADDPMTDEEMTAISEDRLEELGEALAGRRDEWVTAKKASGVEKRWMEDLDQYHGRDHNTKQAASMMDAAEQGYPVTNREAKPQRSTLYVNITRPKSNAVEARLANMLFPSDDRNWGLKPSPKPDLIKAALAEATEKAQQEQAQMAQQQQAAQAAAQQGQPAAPDGSQPGVVAPMGAPDQSAPPAAPGLPPQIIAPGAPAPGAASVAQSPLGAPQAQGILGGTQPEPSATAQLAEADEKCKAMQEEIDDQLMECQYNGEGRKLLHDVCVLGTGILKGPIVVNRVRKAWSPMKDSDDPSVYVLEMVKEIKPASEAISPWHVITDPSCGSDPHTGIGIYEYRNINGKQLRELSKQPGYLQDRIAKVLEEGPTQELYMTDHDERVRGDTSGSGSIKPNDKDHFQMWEYWGEFKPDEMRAAGVDIPDDSTESVSGCVIFVNKTVIKAFLNPIETGDIPYDFMQCELVDESCWGYGIPFLMRPSQRALNAAWRQLMDNSGLSVGPQVFIRQKGITPADKRWEITGRKVWLVDDTIQNVKDAFGTIDINNHGQEIQQIIELAMKFADEEASIPSIAMGEKGNAPDTVGGMTILMNSSNVVLGRLVKQFDDSITRPHLRRYYDWNMAYSDNAAIKGDFQVDARGSSALLVRDLQAQSLLALGQFQGSGIIAPFVNWENWFKQVLKLQHIDPTDIMKSDAEIAQMQQQPQQATPDQVRAQAQLQVAQIRAGAAYKTAEAKVQGELAYAQKMQEIEAQNQQARAQERHDEMQLEILKYANQSKQSLEQIKAQLAQTAITERTKRELGQAEIALAQSEGHQDRQHDMEKHAHSLVRDQMSLPGTP